METDPILEALYYITNKSMLVMTLQKCKDGVISEM